jgi:hypothetical protein
MDHVLAFDLVDLRARHCGECPELRTCFMRGASEDQVQEFLKELPTFPETKAASFDEQDKHIYTCTACDQQRASDWLAVQVMRGALLGNWGIHWSHVVVVHASGKTTSFCREEVARGRPREKWGEVPQRAAENPA